MTLAELILTLISKLNRGIQDAQCARGERHYKLRIKRIEAVTNFAPNLITYLSKIKFLRQQQALGNATLDLRQRKEEMFDANVAVMQRFGFVTRQIKYNGANFLFSDVRRRGYHAIPL